MAKNRPRQSAHEISASNVDFRSLNPDPLNLMRLAHVSVKEEHLSKKWLFCRYWRINMLLIITSTGDELFSGINIDDFE